MWDHTVYIRLWKSTTVSKLKKESLALKRDFTNWTRCLDMKLACFCFAFWKENMKAAGQLRWSVITLNPISAVSQLLKLPPSPCSYWSAQHGNTGVGRENPLFAFSHRATRLPLTTYYDLIGRFCNGWLVDRLMRGGVALALRGRGVTYGHSRGVEPCSVLSPSQISIQTTTLFIFILRPFLSKTFVSRPLYLPWDPSRPQRAEPPSWLNRPDRPPSGSAVFSPLDHMTGSVSLSSPRPPPVRTRAVRSMVDEQVCRKTGVVLFCFLLISVSFQFINACKNSCNAFCCIAYTPITVIICKLLLENHVAIIFYWER